MVFDLDVTAETRPGPFGLVSCGPLFIENRYTDWVNYWPHHTLRTLWQLARWVDPLRLRMEFLNAERNTALNGLVRIWKEHRSRMADCTVLPIGDCPDGFNFTGFLFVPRDAKAAAYLLLFRGNTSESEARIRLPVTLPERWMRLAGEGTLHTTECELRFTLPSPKRFLFACSRTEGS